MSDYAIIVIGAGAGGLVVAIGAARAGKKVLLIEKGTYGGDCTNFGCIPSKSLIASAHAAHAIREKNHFGLELDSKAFQAERALERVRTIVSQIRSHEEPPALQTKGVNTITGTARFVNPHTLSVRNAEGQEQLVTGKAIVIAAGSTPYIPSIPGLEGTPFLTNETIFDLTTIPKSLVILGGGPIGCELGQAFQRLGSQVTLVHKKERLLDREESEAQEVIQNQLMKDGMRILLKSQIQQIKYENGHFILSIQPPDQLSLISVETEHLLISTGRRPNVSSLNLEAAGVHYTEKGIPVDDYGRTNISHIWAVGDVTGTPFFTHLAEHQARAVLTSLLLPFFLKKKWDKQPIPRVTYTDPEVASVGLSEKEALRRYPKHSLAIYFHPMTSVDRAITSGRTEGFVKIVTKKWSSQIIGATIVGDRAGELLGQISIAMYAHLPLRKLAQVIFPYPTYSLAIRQTADRWLTQTILPSLQNLFKKRPSHAEKS
jgi:pyruvate/2-oxoglutarate dehydrogenase complex dihydrolipoamide dehydrogenase (E3) component